MSIYGGGKVRVRVRFRGFPKMENNCNFNVSLKMQIHVNNITVQQYLIFDLGRHTIGCFIVTDLKERISGMRKVIHSQFGI